MIKLDLAKYCDNCSLFEPDVNKRVWETEDEFGYHLVERCETIIRCKQAERCKFFVDYLSDKLKGR